jgi:hypothetical protein
VLAALSAELMMLRKSRVVWILMALSPAVVLVDNYLAGIATYKLSTPAMWQNFGTPAQQLGSLLPSQFVIEAVFQLYNTAPFLLLGAVIAGADWGRGTIGTSWVQGPSRARTTVAQFIAVLTTGAVSVLATFAVSGVASLLISWGVGPMGRIAATPSPPTLDLFEAVGVGLLIALAYTAMGFAFGTIGRSAAAGVVIAMAWYLLVETFLSTVSMNIGGWAIRVYDVFPGQSAVTLVGEFGTPGGGLDSQNYEPINAELAGAILTAYLVFWLVISWRLVRRRDFPALVRSPRLRRADPTIRLGSPAPNGVLATVRAELTVLAHWPTMWALVAIYPACLLLWDYIGQYLLYLSIGHGAITLSAKSTVLPFILPGDAVAVVMNGLGFYGDPPGEVAFFLIGALVGGSYWSAGAVKTALMQAPGRASAAVGQALAVASAAVVSVIGAFAVALVASELFALATTGSFAPAAGPFPALARLFEAVGAAVLIAAAWGLTGWAAATWLRSATAAFGAILLWYTVLQSSLDQFVIVLAGPMRVLYDLLPDAATNTLSFLYGYVNYYGGSLPFYGSVRPFVATLTLLVYALACVAAGVVLTRRRDLS